MNYKKTVEDILREAIDPKWTGVGNVTRGGSASLASRAWDHFQRTMPNYLAFHKDTDAFKGAEPTPSDLRIIKTIFQYAASQQDTAMAKEMYEKDLTDVGRGVLYHSIQTMDSEMGTAVLRAIRGR